MKIATKSLLAVAGAIWLIAGFNIALIGIGAYQHETGWIIAALVLGSAAIFTLFHLCVFNKMVSKHALRILSYTDDRTSVWRFFDTKGYLIMAVMMGGGIGLRLSGVLPEWFIAFFYTGLGIALGIAGVSFLLRYRLQRPAGCPVVPGK